MTGQDAPGTVTLGAESFSLSDRPPSTSRPVRAARAELEQALDVGTLGHDLGRVSLLLTAVSSAARGAGCGDEVEARVSGVRSRVHSLFLQTRSALAEALTAAEEVLQSQSVCVAQFVSGHDEDALASLRSNDRRAEALATRAEKLAKDIGEAADEAGSALEGALAARDGLAETAREADATVEQLHKQRANAWHSHSTVLQSLAECGKLYADAAAAETAARRKAAVCGLFSFVRNVDAYLVGCVGLPVLAPVSAYLCSVQYDAVAKREATRLLLDAKRRQRKLSRDALDDMAECSKKIREVQSEAGATQATVETLCTAAKELRRLAATVLRVAHFWAALRDSAGRLSSREYVSLVEQIGAAKYVKRARVCGGDNSSCAEGSSTAVEVSAECWNPSLPVKRRHVQYFSKWAALADVCTACMTEVDEAGREAMDAMSGSEIPASPGTERRRAMGVTQDVEQEIEVAGKRLSEVIDLTDDGVNGIEAGANAAFTAARKASVSSSSESRAKSSSLRPDL